MDVAATATAAAIANLQQALRSRNYHNALPPASVPLVQSMLNDLMESERQRQEMQCEMQQMRSVQTQLEKNLAESGLISSLAAQVAFDRKHEQMSEVVELKPPRISDLTLINVIIPPEKSMSVDDPRHHRHNNSLNSSSFSHPLVQPLILSPTQEMLKQQQRDTDRRSRFSVSSHNRSESTPLDDIAAASLRNSIKMQEFFGVELDEHQKARHLDNNQQRKSKVYRQRQQARASHRRKATIGVLNDNNDNDNGTDSTVSERQTRSTTHKKPKLWPWSKNKSAKTRRNRNRKKSRKQSRSCDLDDLCCDFSQLFHDDYDADHEYDVNFKQRLSDTFQTPNRPRKPPPTSLKQYSPINANDLLSLALVDCDMDPHAIDAHAMDAVDAEKENRPVPNGLSLTRSTPTRNCRSPTPFGGGCILSPARSNRSRGRRLCWKE